MAKKERRIFQGRSIETTVEVRCRAKTDVRRPIRRESERVGRVDFLELRRTGRDFSPWTSGYFGDGARRA